MIVQRARSFSSVSFAPDFVDFHTGVARGTVNTSSQLRGLLPTREGAECCPPLVEWRANIPSKTQDPKFDGTAKLAGSEDICLSR